MTKKFWCHYIGSDGNTPKRRSIELTPITDILPRMKDCKAATPLWFEKKADDYMKDYYYYILYAQLTDKVAVNIQQRLTTPEIDDLLKSEADMKANTDKAYEYDVKRAKTDEERKTVDDRKAKYFQSMVDHQRDYYEKLSWLSDFTTYLLSQARWITVAMLRAYEEIQSPALSTLQALRKAMEQKREEERKAMHERWQKDREEQLRKHNEEVMKEQQRLTAEAIKFKNGGSIDGCDVVSLCRRYGINVHLRTVHNLQQVVTDINAKEGNCNYRSVRGKRDPNLDGCFKTAHALYDYLQEHEAA